MTVNKSPKPELVLPESNPITPRSIGNVTSTRLFRGPMPPPEMLEGYERVFSGCAERIVAMTEGQASHRQKMESRVLWFDGIQSLLGNILAFLVVIAGLGIGAWLIMEDKDGAGLLTAGVPLAGSFFAWFKTHGGKTDNPDDEETKK